MFNGYTPSAAQLTHLKELTVDVAGVCGSGIAVTEVMSGLTVSADLDWTVLHVTKECRDLVHVQKLNRRVAQLGGILCFDAILTEVYRSDTVA